MEFVNIILLSIYFISLYFTIFWIVVFIEDKKQSAPTNKKKEFSPSISVIIPAYNEQESIEKTLLSVLSLEYPKEKLQIVIVNDGSTDNTTAIISSVIDTHKEYDIVVINQQNKGKGAALNAGLNKVTGEYFACLDADSFVHKNTLRKMVDFYAAAEEEVVIVTPTLKVASPKRFWQKIQAIEYIISIFIAKLMSKVDCLYVAPGPFSLYKTAVIKRLGGFDENNLTEDQEIAYRVQKNNLKIKQCPSADVYTNAPKTFSELYVQRNRWFKGGLFNALKYKNMLLNKSYGDFGILQMSINVMLFIFSITTISFFFYYAIMPLLRRFYHLYLVGFDIKPFLQDIFTINLDILSLNITTMFIVNIALLITIFLI